MNQWGLLLVEKFGQLKNVSSQQAANVSSFLLCLLALWQGFEVTSTTWSAKHTLCAQQPCSLTRGLSRGCRAFVKCRTRGRHHFDWSMPSSEIKQQTSNISCLMQDIKCWWKTVVSRRQSSFFHGSLAWCRLEQRERCGIWVSTSNFTVPPPEAKTQDNGRLPLHLNGPCIFWPAHTCQLPRVRLIEKIQ